jgi:transposase
MGYFACIALQYLIRYLYVNRSLFHFMSLPRFVPQSPLFSTATLSGNFFGPSDRFYIFAQKIYPLLVGARAQLVRGYCPGNGRPAVEPVLLAGLTLLQFMEAVPDRQALELLRYHAGWIFALNRSLGDELFHPTVLVHFRDRLLAHQDSALVFGCLLEGLMAAGLVERRGKQRLDSLQVMGLVSRMSRLECVRETLRLALQELQESSVAFGRPLFWGKLWECYVANKLDYRAQAPVLQEKMNQAGLDGVQLLAWVKTLSDSKVAQGRQVQLLERVLSENFVIDAQAALEPKEALPPGAVQNPHEPQAQWAAKGHGKNRKEHVGYKVQVAETVVKEVLVKGEPTRNFLTGIATQPASASDEAGAEQMEQEQEAMGLEKPTQLYVDGAYVSAQKLVQAQVEGRELIGPAQPAPKKEGRFSVEDFQIMVEESKAICPAGKENTQCSRLEEATGKVSYRFEFSTHCYTCPLANQCLGKDQRHRTVTVGEYHTALQNRRQEQKTQTFKQKVRHRNAIEGTQSELVRAHGLRHARYRGEDKVRLQNYFIGAACNAKRWIRRIIWELKQSQRGAKVLVASG